MPRQRQVRHSRNRRAAHAQLPPPPLAGQSQTMSVDGLLITSPVPLILSGIPAGITINGNPVTSATQPSLVSVLCVADGPMLPIHGYKIPANVPQIRTHNGGYLTPVEVPSLPWAIGTVITDALYVDPGMDTTFTVLDASPFRRGDILSYGTELMQVAVADVPGGQLEVIRGYGGSTPVYLQNTRWLFRTGWAALP